MKIENISGNQAFVSLQYHRREWSIPPIKAGILPYRRGEGGQIEFLLQRPKTTKPEDEGKTLPFQIARGSRRLTAVKDREVRGDDEAMEYLREMDEYLELSGNNIRLNDRLEVRNRKEAELFGVAGEDDFVPAAEDAVREGREELGITQEGIRTLKDCGPLVFRDYGVHLLAAEMNRQIKLLPPDDSHEVRWMTLEQAREQAQNGEFKADYLPMLEAADAAISKVKANQIQQSAASGGPRR